MFFRHGLKYGLNIDSANCLLYMATLLHGVLGINNLSFNGCSGLCDLLHAVIRICYFKVLVLFPRFQNSNETFTSFEFSSLIIKFMK